jgi:hypothetical protein
MPGMTVLPSISTDRFVVVSKCRRPSVVTWSNLWGKGRFYRVVGKIIHHCHHAIVGHQARFK